MLATSCMYVLDFSGFVYNMKEAGSHGRPSCHQQSVTSGTAMIVGCAFTDVRVNTNPASFCKIAEHYTDLLPIVVSQYYMLLLYVADCEATHFVPEERDL